MATPKTQNLPAGSDLSRRGDDEVPFLNSRAASTPMGAAAAKIELRALRSRLDALSRHEGREVHEIGTVLNTLYMRHADVSLGHRSFRQFLLAEFADDPRRAYEAMTVARAATVTLASEKGARWVLRAVTWAQLEGHGPDLSPCLTLPVTVGEDRAVPLRDTTIRALDEAIGRRAVKALDEPVGRRLQRARARVTELTARDTAVAALEPSVFLDDGEVVVRTVSRRADDAKAIRRLYAAVWGKR